jgi:hypothetical protein
VVRDKTFGPAIVFRAQRHLIENPDDTRLVEGHPNGSLIIVGEQKICDYASSLPPECDEIASACGQWDRNLDWTISGHGHGILEGEKHIGLLAFRPTSESNS